MSATPGRSPGVFSLAASTELDEAPGAARAVLAGVRAAIWPSRNAGVSRRFTAAVAILATLALAAAFASLSVGPVHISVSEVWRGLAQHLGLGATVPRTDELVLMQVRLPRIVAGALVGLALGVGGTIAQGIFRNPMADPGIIGVSAGGALGAVIALATGLAAVFPLALPATAFLGAVVSTALVYGISLAAGGFSTATLLLAGIAVNAFLSAVVSATIVLMPESTQIRGILFWLAGGLAGLNWEQVRLTAPFILGGAAASLFFARDLNVLMIGDDDARSLGVNVTLVRTLLVVLMTLMTGTAVAISGVIAFVGLVVPHMLRLIFGPDHRVLMPASALGGALFLVVADTLSRVVAQPAEVSVGIVTALVGAPFFVFLLIRNKRRVYTM